MTDNNPTVKEHSDFVKAVTSMKYGDLEWVAKQMANAFSEDMDRDYDNIPQEEITRMAHALIYVCENIIENGSGDN